MTILSPLSPSATLKASTSSPVNGFANHWRDDLVKIWTHSHPVVRARAIASLTPPAIDICAPSSGRAAGPAGGVDFFAAPFDAIVVAPRPRGGEMHCYTNARALRASR